VKIFAQKNKNQRGFTLMELLVVIAIVGILATLAILMFRDAQAKARDAKRKSDLKNISTALEMYNNDYGKYPIPIVCVGEVCAPVECTEAEGCPQVPITELYRIPEMVEYLPTKPDDPLAGRGVEHSYIYRVTPDGANYNLGGIMERSDDLAKNDGGRSDIVYETYNVYPAALPIIATGHGGGGSGGGGHISPPPTPLDPPAPPAWTCGIDKVTYGASGETAQDYETVLIGTGDTAQCWLKENLNVGTRVDGTREQNNTARIEKYCYDNNENNCSENKFGGLYQWAEAMGLPYNCNSLDVDCRANVVSPHQGICPSGWHIPTHSEWVKLERTVCVDNIATRIDECAIKFPDDTITNNFRGTNEGDKLKKTGCLPDGARRVSAACGVTGFDALLAGIRTYGLFEFSQINEYTIFWSATSQEVEGEAVMDADGFHIVTGYDPWIRGLHSDYGGIQRRPDEKRNAYSVRCVKD